MADELISVTVEDGKYTIRERAPHQWECLRYGEPRPAFVNGPDNLHMALAREIDALRKLVDGFVEKVDPACTVERDHPQVELADALIAVRGHPNKWKAGV